MKKVVIYIYILVQMGGLLIAQEEWIGQMVEVKLLTGEKFEGKLLAIDPQYITIQTNVGELRIERKNILVLNLKGSPSGGFTYPEERSKTGSYSSSSPYRPPSSAKLYSEYLYKRVLIKLISGREIEGVVVGVEGDKIILRTDYGDILVSKAEIFSIMPLNKIKKRGVKYYFSIYPSLGYYNWTGDKTGKILYDDGWEENVNIFDYLNLNTGGLIGNFGLSAGFMVNNFVFDFGINFEYFKKNLPSTPPTGVGDISGSFSIFSINFPLRFGIYQKPISFLFSIAPSYLLYRLDYNYNAQFYDYEYGYTYVKKNLTEDSKAYSLLTGMLVKMKVVDFFGFYFSGEYRLSLGKSNVSGKYYGYEETWEWEDTETGKIVSKYDFSGFSIKFGLVFEYWP